MPDADCKPRSSVVVSIKGVGGSLVVDAYCNSLPIIEGVPGAGRILALGGSNELLTPAFTSQDTTASTRNTNGRLVQHQFSAQESSDAIQAADQAFRLMRSDVPSEVLGGLERQYGNWQVTRTASWIEAKTIADTGGAISYICPISENSCVLGVYFPDADCHRRAVVTLSFVADRGSWAADAECLHTSQEGGRFLLLGDASPDLLSVISGQYVTVSTRSQNRSFVQHRFVTKGAVEAVAYTSMEHLKVKKGRSTLGGKTRLQPPSIYPPRNQYIGNTEAVLRESKTAPK
ncbi:MAG: hypothetical protein IV103_08255 [Zoogloea sp.]|nr:hypothetical protein [Zoogloea sp.]